MKMKNVLTTGFVVVLLGLLVGAALAVQAPAVVYADDVIETEDITEVLAKAWDIEFTLVGAPPMPPALSTNPRMYYVYAEVMTAHFAINGSADTNVILFVTGYYPVGCGQREIESLYITGTQIDVTMRAGISKEKACAAAISPFDELAIPLPGTFDESITYVVTVNGFVATQE